MFNRKCQYTIPAIPVPVDHDINRNAELRINESKLKAKTYTDQKHHARDISITCGDQVIVKQDRTNKLSPNFKCHPYTITAQKGTMNTAKSNIDGHCTTRNISHFKKIPLHVKFPFIKEEEEGALIEQNA